MEHQTQKPPKSSLCTLPVVRLAYGKREAYWWVSYYLQQTRVAEVVYCLAVFTIKLAILLEFLRIFSPGKNHNTFWIYDIFIWLNFLFYVIVSFLVIFPCQPIKKFWKPWTDGRCLNTTKVNIAIAGFNSASDLCLLILPQKVIWDLQMSFKRRIGVSAIFLAGLL